MQIRGNVHSVLLAALVILSQANIVRADDQAASQTFASLDNTIQVTGSADWTVSSSGAYPSAQLQLLNAKTICSARLFTFPRQDMDVTFDDFVKSQRAEFVAGFAGADMLDPQNIQIGNSPAVQWIMRWTNATGDRMTTLITLAQTAHEYVTLVGEGKREDFNAGLDDIKALTSSLTEIQGAPAPPPPVGADTGQTLPAVHGADLEMNAPGGWADDPSCPARGVQFHLTNPAEHGIGFGYVYRMGSFRDMDDFARTAYDNMHRVYPHADIAVSKRVVINGGPALQWTMTFTDSDGMHWGVLTTVLQTPRYMVEFRALAPQSTFANILPELTALAQGIRETPQNLGSGRVVKILGLCVLDLGNSEHGGIVEFIASRSAEDRPDHPVKMIGRVGSMFRIALDESIRLISIRHPEGIQPIDLSFGNKLSSNDGPSGGTAFTLLLLSANGDFDINPDACITGDITVDGLVRAVGGVPIKVHGAALDHCRIAAIPIENAHDMMEAELLNPQALWEIQVFSIHTVDDAIKVMRKDPNPSFLEALDLFDELKASYADKPLASLKTPAVRQKLAAILRLAPNHLSARDLQEFANGTAPAHLSVDTTITEAYVAMGPMLDGLLYLKDLRAEYATQQIASSTKRRLAAIRKVADPTTVRLLATMSAFAEAYEAWGEIELGFSGASDDQIHQALQNVVAAHNDYVFAIQNITSDPGYFDKLIHGQQ